MQPRLRNSSTVARPVSPPETTKADRPAEKPVEFAIRFPNAARTVAVAGSFNNWDPKRTPLKRAGENWATTLWLPPGRYEYRFVIDGEWSHDPKARETAPNPFGSVNSVLTVP